MEVASGVFLELDYHNEARNVQDARLYQGFVYGLALFRLLASESWRAIDSGCCGFDSIDVE